MLRLVRDLLDLWVLLSREKDGFKFRLQTVVVFENLLRIEVYDQELVRSLSGYISKLTVTCSQPVEPRW